MAGVRNPIVVALVVCALLAVPPSVESATFQEAGLRIVVLGGEDSVSIIEGGTTVRTLVEVRDAEDQPVSGASVLFQLEEDDDLATLNDGLQQVTRTTNTLGQAAVTVNPIASGTAQLLVTATFRGQTATAVIVHTTFATVAEAEAAGVGVSDAIGRDTGRDTGGDAGGGAAADGGLGTGATVGIIGGGVGAAVGVGVAVAGGAGGGATRTVTPSPPEQSLVAADRAVLVELYNATNGANWTNNTNWLSNRPLSEWFGVRTDRRGRVIGLDLGHYDDVGGGGGNNLVGSIPSVVGQLSELSRLELIGNNGLRGSIPSSLGNLTNLTWLRLGDFFDDGGLSGPIPSALGNLTGLTRLSLWGELEGRIPPTLGALTNLRSLNLGQNRLTGQIPEELGRLTRLYFLNLGQNRLTGRIPPALAQLTDLETLALSSNRLTGSIPPRLARLDNLESLLLYNNRLTGAIPAALCRFRDEINPQQGNRNLPCRSGSAAAARSSGALSVSDAWVEEAVGAAIAFTVTLSGAPSDQVRVDYATRDGSARAGEDYTASAGHVDVRGWRVVEDGQGGGTRRCATTRARRRSRWCWRTRRGRGSRTPRRPGRSRTGT